MFCCLYCTQLSRTLNNIDPVSTILNNIVDKCEQRWRHGTVKPQAQCFWCRDRPCEYLICTSKMPKLNCVAVYCGSNNGINPAFADAAKELGELLLKRNISLVYGGGSKGIMGLIARTVHNGGGKVEGVITDFFVEATKPLIGETVIVEDMHTRKRMICEKIKRECKSTQVLTFRGWKRKSQISQMIHSLVSIAQKLKLAMICDGLASRLIWAKTMCMWRADAFIALPGGIGTMEEIVEMICWSKLKLHRKPVGMMNIGNYYDGFFNWYHKAFDEGFLDGDDTKIINVSDNCEQLLDMLESKL